MLPLLTWLIQGAVGPAVAGLPATWAATELVAAAGKWFRRLRRSDGLSRIVMAAVGIEIELSDSEFTAIRNLLQQESTWVLAGRGTVEDLAGQIASCLSNREPEHAQTAGRAIAGGLLEFAVRDLEPEWFQKVLFARLDRLQSAQASALDRAMFALHADLAAQLAAQDAATANRLEGLADRLTRVLDQFPPGAADQGDVALYLATLVTWLNADPWPQDSRFSGPALTPAQIERKLRIGQGYTASDSFVDADELGRQCRRLVVLGGPGSGKTWFARRTARLCAEAALQALADGAGVDEVELPLYVTCARLAKAPPGEGIRRAVVSIALGQLPDLGGARIMAAVCALFEERSAATLLVADSLDEANGADDRVVQADSLPSSWRIVLTSRPGSWNRQLVMDRRDEELRQVGYLQPLIYPDDVEAFIARWFVGKPEWATDLMVQIRDRPAFQEAATVPLIVAFYCIIGGRQPLPDSRAALYTAVVSRMITGRWRGSANHNPDKDACLRTLRAWAWSAAASDPVSGIGTWTDEFPTPRVAGSDDDQAALDHVAVPLGLADLDSGMTPRRFVHQSVREHMVAEHIAISMATEPAAAAAELLNHLWYDTDWEHAAPAAIARHDARDQILREIIRQVTGRTDLPSDLSAVDGCWEIRKFLSRVALEAGPEKWTADASALIGQARIDLVAAGYRGHLGQVANGWTASNMAIGGMLLTDLAQTEDINPSTELAAALARLDVTPGNRAALRGPLIELLERSAARSTGSQRTAMLARTLVRLAPGEAERRRARQAVVGQLAGERDSRWAQELGQAAVALAVSPEERDQLHRTVLDMLISASDIRQTARLAQALARLDPPRQDAAPAREALLGLLAKETAGLWVALAGQALAELEPDEQERARACETLLGMLAREPVSGGAQELADAVARLAATPQTRTRARDAIALILTTERDADRVILLEKALITLAVTPEERGHAFQAVLALLHEETRTDQIRLHARTLAALADTFDDRARARETLLGLLAREQDTDQCLQVAASVARLGPTEQDRARVLDALLERLAGDLDAGRCAKLADAVATFAVTAAERAHARGALLALVSAEDGPQRLILLRALLVLNPDEADRARAVEVLLALLADEAHGDQAVEFARAVADFSVTEPERARARQSLLSVLMRSDNSWRVARLTAVLATLNPTGDDLERARGQLLWHVTARSGNYSALISLAHGLVGLAASAAEVARVREPLAECLPGTRDRRQALEIVGALADLGPTEAQRAMARAALIGLFPAEKSRDALLEIADALIKLGPTVQDRALIGDMLLEKLKPADEPQADPAAAALLDYQLRRGRRPVDPFWPPRPVEDPLAGPTGVELLTRFAVTVDERARTRAALAGYLARERRADLARNVKRAIALLADGPAQTREALIELLGDSSADEATEVVKTLLSMDLSEHERARAKEALTALLARESVFLGPLAGSLADLKVTVADLIGSQSWATRPDATLLAAARGNSLLRDWVKAVPSLGTSWPLATAGRA